MELSRFLVAEVLAGVPVCAGNMFGLRFTICYLLFSEALSPGAQLTGWLRLLGIISILWQTVEYDNEEIKRRAS